MDYSLLVGIHNADQASRVRAGVVEGGGSEGAVTPDHRRPQAQKALYSTAMESIQGEAKGKGPLETEDQLVNILFFHPLMFLFDFRWNHAVHLFSKYFYVYLFCLL